MRFLPSNSVRAVYIGLLLLLGACTTAAPIVEPYVAALAGRVTREWKPRERRGFGDGVILLGGMRVIRNRFSRPSGNNPIEYAANSYTQASGVTFSQVTGQFTKSTWYFGSAPTRRNSAINTGANDFNPVNSAALTAALAGLSGKTDPIIQLDVGTTYTGAFLVPTKVWTGTLVIRSGTLSGIPSGIDGGSSTRVSSSHASSMAQIRTNSTTPCLSVNADGDDLWVEGVEINTVTNNTHGILAGHTNNGVNTVAKIPERVAFVHNYIHLDATLTPTTSVKGLFNETEYSLVADNYISGWRAVGAEAGAYQVTGYTLGPQDVVNNYLEGAGENIFFGGGDTVLGGTETWPADIYVARNHIYTPSAWFTSWQRKNPFEIKKGERYTVTANIIDGSWGDDGAGPGLGAQDGHAITIKNTNQSGGNTNQKSQDITFRYNLIRNCGGFASLLTAENATLTFPLSRVELRDNLAYDLNSTTYFLTDGQPGFFEVVGSTFATGATGLRILHNTCSFARAPKKCIHAGADSGPANWPIWDLIVVQDNIMGHRGNGNPCGLMGDSSAEGTASITGRWTNYTFSFNLFHTTGGTPSSPTMGNYPTGNWFETAESGVGFTSVAGDDYSIADGTTYGRKGSRAASDDSTYPSGKALGADVALVLSLTASVV